MQEQTPTGDDLLQFNKEYYSFNMAVTMSDGKLNIKVCDFVDWIHYGKQFTEANIGAEIHKKVDLEDIYFSLVLNKDNEPKDKQEPGDYTFGDVIKNGQRECFKFEKGGKLTVFTPGIDSKTGKQIYHESKLNLKQVRSMTQMQILSQKMLGQKRQHSKKFQCQLEQLKQQCINLRQQYKKLQHQNVNLSQQLSSTKQQITIIKQQQMKTNEQIKVNREEFKKYNEELLNKIKQLTQENNKYKQSLMKEINKNKDNNTKELQSLQTRYKKDVGQIMNKINIFSLGQIYQNKFKIYLNSHIQYSGQNGAFTHFIFNQKIVFNTPYTFRIKILKTVSRYIMIGVVDFNKQKDQRSSYGSGNAVCYYGCNGYKYGQATTEGAGFSEGEVVEINVNLAAKLIKWSVAGTQRASCTLDLLGDQSRVFMPFVQMYNTNDIIQWYFD